MSSSSSLPQLAHLKIPLKEILSATNNFSDANIIGRDGFGNDYKGQLLWSGQLVDIVARRLTHMYGQGNKEFWTEVLMLSKLKHKHIVSIIGFCDENDEKIVINRHEAHGSLYEYLRDPTLRWMRRLQICVDVGHALSYIHYDKRRDFSVIHRDIKSSKILLDDRWEAKLSGFELSITQTAARRDGLVLADPCGTPRYRDPTYTESGSLTHKSDMYSFGMVLFEVLCGKEVAMTDMDNWFVPSSARSHYERGRLEDMIDPVLWQQMNTKSFKIFSETAYYCLKERRQERPNIYQIVMNLEQALESQRKHENPLISKADSMINGKTPKSLKREDLKHLEIPFADIKLATKNFAEEYLIGSGTYGDVYKAELDHFDGNKIVQIEEDNNGDFPKKRSTVAIKRILIREDRQGEEGFLAEIEMLTSCKHANIVSLLGFCEEDRHMILVYEHASNGSLDAYLGSTSKLTNLTWVQRINICIDIARGLKYLHTKIEDNRRIIHRDIKSYNILLDENWVAKIADFGLSKFRPQDQQVNKTLFTQTLAGTELYWDPEYVKTGNLKNESDIYSFGVVLFELMSGKFANDPIYTNENSNGIAHVARRHYNEGTIKALVDHRLMDETHENILNRGPDQKSLYAFAEIAYQCVAESQGERPPAEVVIKKLEEALSYQENIKDQLKFSVKEIALATQNFSDENLIGEGGFGKVYKGELTHANGRNTIAAKRLDRRFGQGEKEFLMELQVLLEYKHENIIGIVGYCNEMGETIILYEYASRGSLDKHLKDNSLTWMKRLQICIDIASGLGVLHSGVTQDLVIHRDIKSSNVLLTNDWKAKITNFGLSLISAINKDMDFVIGAVAGTAGYCDPLYVESDIYSFGVVLLEILCGRLTIDPNNRDMQRLYLPFLAKKKFEEGTFDEMVFEGIRDDIAPKSLITFQSIALQCLHLKREGRPTTDEVLVRLQEALEFQEDYDIWKPKLPVDYKILIQMSHSQEINSTEKYKDLYDMFSKGILLQEGKVLFSLDSNGERSEMISATKFSYKHRWSHKWRSVQGSRFHKVAEMLDITKLQIQVKIKPQFLSPGVEYGVHLVFRFCGPRKSVGKRMYVNLKYKKGSETLHAHFATWREDGWMTTELYRFWKNNQNTDCEVSLESFSRCYCESRSVYVEGIEFRAIHNVRHEENNELKQNQQPLKSDLNVDQVQQLPTIFEKVDNYNEGEKLSLNKVIKKKHFMLLAKEVLYDSSNVKLFDSLQSTQSRFRDAIELPRQQILRIKCKIGSQNLSPDTDYACYLLFKLSEKGHGLDSPVIVRDLLQQRKYKDKGILYFKSPSPHNVDDTDRVPQEREDGWMEVNVWQFRNSISEIRNDCISVSLKLVSYKETMSGLIVSGLEIRPM